MRTVILLLGIIIGAALETKLDKEFLYQLKVLTVRKINQGLRPMSPTMEKYHGKTTIFDPPAKSK